MVDFSKVTGAAFSHFGQAASYLPPEGGTAVSCTAVCKAPQMDDASFGTPGYQLSSERQAIALLADVRQSEIATPKQGGTLTTEGRDYPIRSVLLDTQRQVWRLSLGKPA